MGLLRNLTQALCGRVQPSVQNRTGASRGRYVYPPLRKGRVYKDETGAYFANFAKRLTLIEPFQYPRLQSPSLSAASNFPALSTCDPARWTSASRRRYPPRTYRASSALSESPARAA